nr:proline-rich receptor-like protein kinase PERK5 [Aegilops tauschii subsp. strangulata]
MAKSGARKEAAPARSSATSPPPQHVPGAPAGSCASRSPQPLFYAGAPTSSSTSPSTPPHLYPPLMESSTANPTWRPMYTPAPEGLLSFGQFPPMHPYNFRPPSMHHPEQGHQNMENLHFVGASPHDSFSTPPPPPRSTSSKRKKRKVANVDDDELGERTAYRLDDINVLNQSTLFLEQLKGQAPQVNYNVNEKEYQLGYYLVDGIYPEWTAFVK